MPQRSTFSIQPMVEGWWLVVGFVSSLVMTLFGLFVVSLPATILVAILLALLVQLAGVSDPTTLQIIGFLVVSVVIGMIITGQLIRRRW